MILVKCVNKYFIDDESQYKRNKFVYIAVGATAGFIGQYLGDQIYNFVTKSRELQFSSNINSYIAGIISGAAVGALSINLNLFQSTVLSVGLFYAIFEGFKVFTGEKLKVDSELLKAFVEDIVVVYILLVIENELFPEQEKPEEAIFEEELISNIVSGIIVNAYYSFKRLNFKS